MSKKKHVAQKNDTGSHGLANEAEYKVIGGDLLRVIVLNALYLAGLLAVYYTNKQSRYLEHYFSRIFNW